MARPVAGSAAACAPDRRPQASGEVRTARLEGQGARRNVVARGALARSRDRRALHGMGRDSRPHRRDFRARRRRDGPAAVVVDGAGQLLTAQDDGSGAGDRHVAQHSGHVDFKHAASDDPAARLRGSARPAARNRRRPNTSGAGPARRRAVALRLCRAAPSAARALIPIWRAGSEGPARLHRPHGRRDHARRAARCGVRPMRASFSSC